MKNRKLMALAGGAAVLFSVGALLSCDIAGNDPPEAPSGLSGTPLSSTEISLSWRDNSDNEDGFLIEYGTTSTNLNLSRYASDDTEELTIAGLTASTLYYFRVCAQNSNGDSDFSSRISVQTLAVDDGGGGGGEAPAAPSGLAATAISSSSISLSWTDNSDDESGFKIHRSLFSDSSYTEIDTVGVGQESYTDLGLEADTTYYYRVYAYNSSGTSGYTSDSATTTIFEEGFESMSPDWRLSPSVTGFQQYYSYARFNAGANSTAWSYFLDGGTDLAGYAMYHNFPSSQANRFEIYIWPAHTTTWGGIVVLSSASGASCWVVFADGNICSSNGQTVFVGPTYTPGWYRIEFRDINWTSKNYDLYVNGAAAAYNLGFKDSSASAMTQIQLYNSDPLAEFFFDEILIE